MRPSPDRVSRPRKTEHGRGSKGPTRETDRVQGRPGRREVGPAPDVVTYAVGGAAGLHAAAAAGRRLWGRCWGAVGLRVGWQACDSPHQEMRRVLQLQVDEGAAACAKLKRDSVEKMETRCCLDKDASQCGAA